MTYTVAIVGTGTEPDDPGRDGYAMAYHHAAGYEKLDDCELVACADIVRENAEAFADEFGLSDDAVFEEYGAMLSAVEPDIVSVCVPPAVHADITVDCIESGVVQAVHCEKPMADTYGDARAMAEAADRHGVQLTINHQRRFSDAVRTAKQLLDDGEIGDLERVEFAAPVGLFDYGSHSFDLCNYFADESPAKWVLAQIDYSEENVLFGTHNENQAVVHWEYDSGVHGVGTSDSDFGGGGGPTAAVACHNRLVGSDGVIEVGAHDEGEELPPLRIRRDGEGWETVETDDGLHGWEFIDRALAENVRCLREGDEPELGSDNALRATELIFAAWESSRRRGRVDLPLDIDDNPLQSMLDSGDLSPAPTSSGDD
ncbi:Gfo/Idh/MocA family protein [Candidatus Halobonum tyrrellensis]|uniref:Oxidoreductase domain-containing protein n=1 Tax=Candidatus Halobonum tyrrellensis G22 TaxID=1324957 RepID=V4H8N3_9EURY|nr:Gfo/Idh/MocA family oxidoreductase [Candidatus Halobonum tyrrellensis]ESP87080.1 oxidoreductase domain-containing protein [Candidatus Halobonum tyrrellensis G22]